MEKIVQLNVLINQLSSQQEAFKADHFQPVNASQIQTLLADDQLLINYFWGKTSLYAIALGRNSILSNRIPVDLIHSDLRSSIEIIRRYDIGDIEQQYQRFSTASYNLFSHLLQPLIKHESSNSQTIKRLIIVPHGELNLLPFNVLLKSEPPPELDFRSLDYLVKNYTITYSFSASLLAFDRSTEVIDTSFLGFADATLPGALKEIETAVRHWPDGSDIFTNKAGTEENFKKYVGDYDVLHIAHHASAGGTGDLPSISFTKDSESDEDGFLYPYEIYPLSLRASLTVLSACETGLGTGYQGEGVFSLARSFFYAGSNTVIMSLWKVADDKTTELMDQFYNQLSSQCTIAQSMRSAQLLFLELGDEISAHPSNWASFVIQGNGEQKLRYYDANFILVLVLSIALILISLYLLRRTLVVQTFRRLLSHST